MVGRLPVRLARERCKTEAACSGSWLGLFALPVAASPSTRAPSVEGHRGTAPNERQRTDSMGIDLRKSSTAPTSRVQLPEGTSDRLAYRCATRVHGRMLPEAIKRISPACASKAAFKARSGAGAAAAMIRNRRRMPAAPGLSAADTRDAWSSCRTRTIFDNATKPALPAQKSP